MRYKKLGLVYAPDPLKQTFRRLIGKLSLRFAIAAAFLAARYGFSSHNRELALFDAAQKFGVHIRPVHFYSPVPDTSNIPEKTWTMTYDFPGITISEEKCRAFFDRLAPYAGEMTQFPKEKGANHGFYYDNSAFCTGDAYLLYCIVRDLKPRRIIEIGSGFSTMLMRSAIDRNGAGEITCIEPFPNADIERLAATGAVTLRRDIVQNIPIDAFDVLEANDILFIDSTHVSKIGSDVNYELLRIVPRLKPGVTVHVHDIFLPFEYDRRWVVEKKIHWNEQYVLAAFMAFNSEFSALFANMLCEVETYRSIARQAFPDCEVLSGGSFWFRRDAAMAEAPELG